MRAVNLLPRDVKQERSTGGRMPLLAAAGGLAAATAASIVMFVSASSAVGDQQAQLESVEAAIARIPGRASPVLAPGVIAQERSERVNALSAALGARVPVDRLLRELTYVLPEDTWLTGLTAAVPASAVPAAPSAGAPAPATGASTQGVTIVGATYSHRSVARVLSRLAATPMLKNVRLGASARIVTDASADGTTRAARPVVTFTITADLETGGAA